MKRTILIILLFFCATKIFASHIVGGEVYYKYIGPGSSAGTSVYEISLRLFRDCNVPCGDSTNVACLPVRAVVTIYLGTLPYSRMRILGLPLRDSLSITLTTYPPCVAYKPPVCYEVKTYSDTVSLADNDVGYIMAYQNCCRAASKNQFGVEFTASGVPGVTYTANIPGKNVLPAEHNSSAVFNLKDTALVCSGTKFAIDFGADDANGDSLSYAFASAYNGGIFWSDGCTATPETGLVCEGTCAGPPPYDTITYNTAFGFSGTQPLGKDVSIDPVTGIISGTASSVAGRYIVNVFVYEWRHGKLIASHQKDFIIRVEECNIPKAKLEPSYLTCDGFHLNFENESTSPLIFSYYWDFGDPTNALDTSTNPTPGYNFPDSGIYKVTLITNRGAQCSDSTTTLAKIYPGFIPDFNAKGGCVLVPYQFMDLTRSKYGTVSNWKWNFGDYPVTSDTSIIQNPQYLYPSPQQTAVTLIVGDTKGCLDTIMKQIIVYDKPPLQLAFKDTLICATDTLQLHASDSLANTPAFSWSPAININNTNIPDPFVYPKSTSIYQVALNDNGCTVNDSVTVNVVPFATLDLGADTTICLTDSIQLFPATNAIYFAWFPVTGISDSKIKNPFAKPLINTEYKLTATVGGCTASDSIKINVAPYPQVTSGADTSICYGKTVVLFAKTIAPSFAWNPVNSLLNANTLTPTAAPTSTTAYIITVTDNNGCPKPASDTTIITVTPPISAFGGNDTVIVANQPLQLNATGGTSYTWSPTTGMNDPYVANPIVTLGTQYDSMTYHVTVSINSCSAGDDIKVIVFKTEPNIFVPSAFTPNGDGRNDIIRPKVVGMKQFNYFRIYNRLGQMLYATSALDQGWDGNISGTPQPTGTYVYMVQAIDYTGRVVTKKGTIVLIR
ncbi:T9SS type B sorting domain-containing protein [Panacibacter ginsenosidivorans]|uniref:T9SS type B sorting domain-containing protein n=1 Tax=Panacibacter ginsenosidivorans TaxID=1813871 RepID=A0A5B8V9N9_9BACT|nr:PKD domain-containing protein [Panacibacter ginsenosidivorans]QEC68187.1 T9SS type B sorting domain-containing protein [Panacibacter ginsenosidivorans]